MSLVSKRQKEMNHESHEQKEINENFCKSHLNVSVNQEEVDTVDQLLVSLEEEFQENIVLKDEDSTNDKNVENVPVSKDVIRDLTKSISSGATFLGNYLYSSAYSAGTNILKHGILQKFDNEQTNFITQQKKPSTSDIPPWIGCRNEEILKEECLNLSSDYRNFLKSSPIGCDFKFEYNSCYPLAEAIMKQDPRLENLRYELVPKRVSEQNFWRNYFYRIGLIFKANEAQMISNEELDENLDYSLDQSNHKLEFE